MFSQVFLCATASSCLLFVICGGRSVDEETAVRSRRSVELTEAEQQAVVDVHNDYRRTVGASDMQKLKWSEELADLAAQWVQKCAAKRGSLLRGATYENKFGSLGQVMDQSDTKPNISAVIDNIVKEQRRTSPEKRCKGNALCFMYDEILGAVSTDVGCATGYCEPMLTKGASPQSNKWFTVCYYGPGREGVLSDPYQKGIACSKCNNDAKWCDQGLCNGDCKKSGGKCECGAECMNCGKVDPETCTCKCPKGFSGDDCSQVCKDNLECCNTVLDGSQSLKDKVCSKKFYQEGCSLSCGVCEVSLEKSGEPCPIDRISPPYKATPGS